MYKGTLTLQSAPSALRLFENTWTHLVHDLDRLLQFIVDRVASAMSWDPVKVHLISPKVVDNLQDEQAKLQLMIGRQISQTTGLQALGVDFREEQRRILEEERYIQEQQANLQREMDQAAAMESMSAPPQQAPGAVPGQPGAPGVMGAAPVDPNAPQLAQGGGPAASASQQVAASMPTQPNAKITPQEMLSKAQTISQALMRMSDSQRHSEMVKLKNADPAIHGIVKARIEDMRQQARTAGGAQVLAQQFGGQQGF
jgi:hypothetical protein